VPLAEIEKFTRTHVPANMDDVIERGLQGAQSQLKRKATLVREADAFLKK
jgi:hypothetical protein